MTNPGTLSVYRLRANSTTILCHYGIIFWPATPPSSSSADLKQFLYYPHSRTQFNFKSTGYRAWWCSCDPLRFPTWTEFLSFLPYNFCAPTPHPEIFRDFGCRMERLRIVIRTVKCCESYIETFHYHYVSKHHVGSCGPLAGSKRRCWACDVQFPCEVRISNFNKICLL